MKNTLFIAFAFSLFIAATSAQAAPDLDKKVTVIHSLKKSLIYQALGSRKVFRRIA